MSYKIENMTEEWGSGWWDATPWRWVSDEGDFGEPFATREEAEADLKRREEQPC